MKKSGCLCGGGVGSTVEVRIIKGGSEKVRNVVH